MEFILLELSNGDRAIVRRDDIVQVVTYTQKLKTIDYYQKVVIAVMKDGTKISLKNNFDDLANRLINNV